VCVCVIIIIIIIHEYYYGGAVALLLQDHLTMCVCVCCQSENVDSSMDHSNASVLSHDADDDKSLVLQYEGD